MYVALLRGVNVLGRTMVSMSDLREVLVEMGFADVRSLMQSGNLVFRSERRLAPASLERMLVAATVRRLGASPDYMVRSAAEWRSIIAANPFPKEAAADPSRFLVMFLSSAPPAKDVKALAAAIRGRERVRAVGRQLYVVYPDGIGRSRLSHGVIERVLATRATGRNWNTVTKLAALLAGE